MDQAKKKLHFSKLDWAALAFGAIMLIVACCLVQGWQKLAIAGLAITFAGIAVGGATTQPDDRGFAFYTSGCLGVAGLVIAGVQILFENATL